jgi:ParB family chromosome partitioning protein
MKSLVAVDKIEKNAWNPNVMGPEEYDALKQDMHVHGVDGVDAVLISPYGTFYGEEDKDLYVIVDGEHRWRAAEELGWKEISCEIQDITEEEAKALCYRRNRERGTIDPFKEALLFKTELPNLTQAKIAGKYGIKQATVSQRLSLLKLDSEVVKKLKDIPRGIISVSHLESLASLELDDQKALAKNIVFEATHYDHPMTVKDVERKAEGLREKREEARLLKEALGKGKFPKCPKCGKEPSNINYKKLPWVDCSSGHYDHSWSLASGKRVYEPERVSQKTMDGESKLLQTKTLRSAHTVQELSAVFVDLIKKIIGEDETLEIKKIDVSGKLQGSDFSFDVSTYGKSTSVSWHNGRARQGFRAEEHDYKSGEKSAITTGSLDNLERVKLLIENAFKGKLGVEQTEQEKKHEHEDRELEEEMEA